MTDSAASAGIARKLPSDETLRRAVEHLATLLDKP